MAALHRYAIISCLQSTLIIKACIGLGIEELATFKLEVVRKVMKTQPLSVQCCPAVRLLASVSKAPVV